MDLLARVIASVVFVAFAEFVPWADANLEYQARFGGIFILAQFGWLIWFSLVLVPAPAWVSHNLQTLFATGTVSGAFSVFVGFTSKTAALIQQGQGLRRYLTLNTLAVIAAGIFVAVLIVLLSRAIDWTLGFHQWSVFTAGATHPRWMLVMAMGAGLLILVVVASLVININRYSLHSIYRNRLVRAFLGASRDEDEREKSKNRFTDFDSRDSPLLYECWEEGKNPRGDNWKPLHVINAALNLVSSKNLAWQERMAAPFTFSALHCGSGSSIFHDGGYRATKPQPT